MPVTLRAVEASDLDRFFEFQQSPRANHMAAFTVRGEEIDEFVLILPS